MMSAIAMTAALAMAGSASDPLAAIARAQLADAGHGGLIDVRDVATGRVLVHESAVSAEDSSPDPALACDAPIAPLSVIKVYVAAIWLEHGLGEETVECAAKAARPARAMRVAEAIASGCDSAGMEMARVLRARLGTEQMLRELRGLRLRELSLDQDTSDEDWGVTLSFGEERVRATPDELATFLATIGEGRPPLSSETARALRGALEDVVTSGTASAIAHALDGTGWRLGGKTGTGPGHCADRCDGWFAGVLSEDDRARYTILVYVRARGIGGGVAAQAAAAMAKRLIATGAAGSR